LLTGRCQAPGVYVTVFFNIKKALYFPHNIFLFLSHDSLNK
jgi:hypothetical protein